MLNPLDSTESASMQSGVSSTRSFVSLSNSGCLISIGLEILAFISYVITFYSLLKPRSDGTTYLLVGDLFLGDAMFDLFL